MHYRLQDVRWRLEQPQYRGPLRFRHEGHQQQPAHTDLCTSAAEPQLNQLVAAPLVTHCAGRSRLILHDRNANDYFLLSEAVCKEVGEREWGEGMGWHGLL